MRTFSSSPDGHLVITPSETSAKTDFDYLIGKWNIRNRTLKKPLTGSDAWEEFDATQEFRVILLGLGNVVADNDVVVKFHWDKRNPEAPIYSRAFSTDAGRTWEWNWRSTFSRR